VLDGIIYYPLASQLEMAPDKVVFCHHTFSVATQEAWFAVSQIVMLDVTLVIYVCKYFSICYWHGIVITVLARSAAFDWHFVLCVKDINMLCNGRKSVCMVVNLTLGDARSALVRAVFPSLKLGTIDLQFVPTFCYLGHWIFVW